MMKTLLLAIIVIVFGILIMLSIQNIKAIPYMSPQDLYKQSYMVFYGQVISKQTGPGPDYYYYQLKVETYFKNPQTSESITVAGHIADNKTRMSYPQFEVGDKAIFYISKLEGINTISPYSTKSGDACDIHAFLGPAPIQGEPLVRGSPSPLTLLDENGLRIGTVSTNHTVLLRYDLTNNYPTSRNFTVEVSVQNQNDTSVTFYKKQIIELGACESIGDALKWSFVPKKSGNYNLSVSEDGKFRAGTSFQVENSNLSENPNSLSPLKQFKSGIKIQDVQCKEGFQLIIRNGNDQPACVRPTTMNKLVSLNWGFDPSKGLTVDGLKDTYNVGEQINFKIKFNELIGDCTDPHVVVKNQINQTIWESKFSPHPCSTNLTLHHAEGQFEFGNPDLGYLRINQTGSYYIHIWFAKEITEKIAVLIP